MRHRTPPVYWTVMVTLLLTIFGWSLIDNCAVYVPASTFGNFESSVQVCPERFVFHVIVCVSVSPAASSSLRESTSHASERHTVSPPEVMVKTREWSEASIRQLLLSLGTNAIVAVNFIDPPTGADC